MSISTYLIGGGIALAVVAAAPLVVLPSSKTVTRTATVQADSAAIYQTVTSTAGFQTFNPYLDTDPDLRIEPFGPAEGIGAGFSFEGNEGKGTQTIAALEENRSVTMNIDMGAMGQPVQTITLTPQGEDTLVEWSVTSDFGMNPVFRVFGLFMDGMLGPIYERGLDNLNTTLLAQA